MSCFMYLSVKNNPKIILLLSKIDVMIILHSASVQQIEWQSVFAVYLCGLYFP